jgi:hypothetical protein
VGNCWLRKDAQDPAIADRYPAAVGDD